MQPTNLQRSNGYVECPRPSSTSAAKARKVALLCGHHLDRLRVLAMASVVRLTADRLGALVKTRKGIGCAES
jgi:hypothetical protein